LTPVAPTQFTPIISLPLPRATRCKLVPAVFTKAFLPHHAERGPSTAITVFF
jgi:hypothetical protein